MSYEVGGRGGGLVGYGGAQKWFSRGYKKGGPREIQYNTNFIFISPW